MRLSTLAAFLIAPLAANATVLLEINVYNPAAVTITSTGAFADAADSTHSLFDGIDLVGFLTGATAPTNLDISGDLMPAEAPNVYNRLYWDNQSGATTDLNLYRMSDYTSQSFSAGAVAFTGSATLNLNTVSALLPDSGATGTIYAGYAGNPSLTAIGEWRAVAVAIPEPSTYAAFLGLGALAVAVVLRRRRS